MFKWLKKLLGRKQEERGKGSIRDSMVPFADVIAEREREEAEEKRKWEQENERLKRRDASYLGTKREAFYGTYEEWRDEQHKDSLAAYARMHMQSQGTHPAQMGAYQGYGYAGYNGIFHRWPL